MTTIPDDIAAMVDALVKSELVRLAPVRCGICERYDECWLHPINKQQTKEKTE